MALVVGVGAFETYYFFKHNPENSQHWVDPNTEFDSELGWRMVAKSDLKLWGGVSSNSHGFRSAEIDPAKQHIILMGDSVAWGFGMGDEYIASHYLQEDVRDNGLQVHNLAVSGYGLGQYYLYLKRHLDKFENVAHLFLMIYAPNDPGDTSSNANYGKRKPLYRLRNNELVLTDQNVKRYCLRNLFSSSYLMTRITHKWNVASEFIGWIAGDKKLKKDEAEDVMIALIEKISRLAEQKGAKFTILISPSVYDFFARTSGFTFFNQYCKETEFNCINLKDEITKRSKLSPKKLYGDPHHYNSKGHRIVADVMAEVVKTKDLLNP